MDTEVHQIPDHPLKEMVSGKATSALIWASTAHQGQIRKQGNNSLDPQEDVLYLVHLVTVMNILTRVGAKRDLICAGCLHDIVEDCDVTIEEVRAEFGERVARYVNGVSKDEHIDSLPMAEKAQAVRDKAFDAGINCCALKGADLLANVTDLVHAAERIGVECFAKLFGPERWVGKIQHYLRLVKLICDDIEINYPSLSSALRFRCDELRVLLAA